MLNINASMQPKLVTSQLCMEYSIAQSAAEARHVKDYDRLNNSQIHCSLLCLFVDVDLTLAEMIKSDGATAEPLLLQSLKKIKLSVLLRW